MKIVGGDYDQRELANALDHDAVNMAAAMFYADMFGNRPGIVYAAGVDHAHRVANAMVAVGLKAAAVSGRTPPRELAYTLAAYERGDVNVLVNAQLLAEGWNAPRATVCVHLAPTASRRVYQQRVGRIMRLHRRKEAGVVIDFVEELAPHTDRTVTLHSLLGVDLYQPGALVTPRSPKARRRWRRAAKPLVTEKPWIVPVTPDPAARRRIIEQDWKTIAIERLPPDEQEHWAEHAALRVQQKDLAKLAKVLLNVTEETRMRFFATCAAQNKSRQLRLIALGDLAQHSPSARVFNEAVKMVEGMPTWRLDRAQGARTLLLALGDGRVPASEHQVVDWIWRLARTSREAQFRRVAAGLPNGRDLARSLAGKSGQAAYDAARLIGTTALSAPLDVGGALVAIVYTTDPSANRLLDQAAHRLVVRPARPRRRPGRQRAAAARAARHAADAAQAAARPARRRAGRGRRRRARARDGAGRCRRLRERATAPTRRRAAAAAAAAAAAPPRRRLWPSPTDTPPRRSRLARTRAGRPSPRPRRPRRPRTATRAPSRRPRPTARPAAAAASSPPGSWSSPTRAPTPHRRPSRSRRAAAASRRPWRSWRSSLRRAARGRGGARRQARPESPEAREHRGRGRAAGGRCACHHGAARASAHGRRRAARAPSSPPPRPSSSPPSPRRSRGARGPQRRRAGGRAGARRGRRRDAGPGAPRSPPGRRRRGRAGGPGCRRRRAGRAVAPPAQHREVGRRPRHQRRLSPTRYDHVLLDLDGAVYVGRSVVPGAPEAIAALRAAGIRTAFVTNDPVSARADYVRRLGYFGIAAASGDVVTAAWAAAQLVAEEHPGARVLALGSDAYRDEHRQAGLQVVDDWHDAEAVSLGGDLDFAFSHLQAAVRAVLAGAALYGSNRDRTYPDDGGTLARRQARSWPPLSTPPTRTPAARASRSGRCSTRRAACWATAAT